MGHRSVRLLGETAVLACAAYVDLNPIRAAMAETIEDSAFTSAQKRIRDLTVQLGSGSAAGSASPATVDGVPSGVGDLEDAAGSDGLWQTGALWNCESSGTRGIAGALRHAGAGCQS